MEESRDYYSQQEDDFRKFAEEHGIENLDMNFIRALGDIKRPLVLVRGRPITVEQTKELITGEEPLFGDGRGRQGFYDPRGSDSILGSIFYKGDFPWLSTWVYSDGTIGGDLVSSCKYPAWDEMIPPYMHLAEKYPFLDIVISYTTYDQSSCYWCEDARHAFGWRDKDLIRWDKCKDCQPYLDKIVKYLRRELNYGYNLNPDFEELYFRSWEFSHVRSDVGDSVELTIWVHNGRTDILSGWEAAGKFNEYNDLYCAPEYAFMFATMLYSPDRTCICSKAFVEDCFEYTGKPRSLCDEYVEMGGIIKPFNENAIVVTKEWVTQQYNTFIKSQKFE